MNRCILLGAMWLMASHLQAFGAMVVLKPVADTGIFEPNPANNIGSASSFPAGAINHDSESRSRGLIKFPIDQIPAGAIVTRAALTLAVTKTPGAGGVSS